VSQSPRIVLIIGMLQATVLRQGRCMGQAHTVAARAHESINEPVSSIGGFDRDILHDDGTVRGMEIDPRITPHRNLLSLGG
jgi:hypothetical protein